MLRKKIIVFYRAWDKSFEKQIEKRYMKIFSRIFFLPQASVVLGAEFQQLLRKWGYKKPIFLESTTVESDLLYGFDIASLIEKRLNRSQIFNILFLSRLEYKKGIFICADAYNILKQKYPNTRLIFGGDGTDFEKLKEYVINNGIKDVVFLGYLTKDKKCQSFADASVFILPTYGEGLPNAVLEAMAFGLPIITRQVGGLPDIIFNEENGFISDSYAPDYFAKCMERLIEDKNLYLKISKNNYQVACTKFLSNVVAKRIENIYLEVLK